MRIFLREDITYEENEYSFKQDGNSRSHCHLSPVCRRDGNRALNDIPRLVSPVRRRNRHRSVLSPEPGREHISNSFVSHRLWAVVCFVSILIDYSHVHVPVIKVLQASRRFLWKTRNPDLFSLHGRVMRSGSEVSVVTGRASWPLDASLLRRMTREETFFPAWQSLTGFHKCALPLSMP